MGGRLLRAWLNRPLVDLTSIHHRQDAIESLKSGRLRRQVLASLRSVSDLERLAGKVAQETANPRDLVNLATSLAALPAVFEPLAQLEPFQNGLPDDMAADVASDIQHWLVDEPPTSLTDGGLIRSGVRVDLDELLALSRDSKAAIAKMEAKQRAETGITSLKIRHNRVFGYYLEVTNAHRNKVPTSWIRKQTLTNAERYITPQLKEFEERALGADERRKALEHALFTDLRHRVSAQVRRIQALAKAIAWVDVIASLAEVCVNNRYVRPVVDNSDRLEVVAGRHPVVEAMNSDEPFVPNDIRMDAKRRLIVLTGPNMAGKSTVMRQVALITFMAQIGCFVPAKKARIGLCDRIFVRVGASDDLARGRSTFMVEMSETALILNQATHRSLILLDEIGRGTSTYDGLSIAWAVAESVHNQVKARTIFATHYHELLKLADELPNAVNQHVAVSEWKEQIIFLRALKEGGASQSYGIQCARLAGVPSTVLDRARAILRGLETGDETPQMTEQELKKEIVKPSDADPNSEYKVVKNKRLKQVGLFADQLVPVKPDRLRDAVATMHPDDLTPRQALEVLYGLKEILEGEFLEPA